VRISDNADGVVIDFDPVEESLKIGLLGLDITLAELFCAPDQGVLLPVRVSIYKIRLLFAARVEGS
jgi:hypothetical protein